MAPADPNTTLTERQLEFLALFASGLNTVEIGEIKFVHYRTVRRDLVKAQKRVGARSMVHLVALAVDAGVIVKDAQSNGGNTYRPVLEQRVIG